ncbi:MAG: PilZ domain-containing protein [Planctomycetota bacterium]
MQALDRALATLEKSTGFSRAFEDIVARRGGWPNRWLTPKQINDELTGRGFWSGGRKAVHIESRERLIKRYLDALIDGPPEESTLGGDESWAGDQPGDSAAVLMGDSTVSGLLNQSSSLHGQKLTPKRRADDTDSDWKRFDGQYKYKPKTKLIEYRGARMGRSFDRRTFMRVPTRDLNCQYGPVLNLSQAGLMFCMVDEKPGMVAGSRGYLRLTHGLTSLRVKVKVVWMSPTPHGTRVGVDFRGLTPRDNKVITQLIRDAGDPDGEPCDRRR